MHRRGRVRAAAAALGAMAVVLGVAACSSSGDGAGGSGGGATLRIGTTYSCNSINPFVSYGQSCGVIFRYNYPYLTQLGPNDAAPIGDFATSWTSDPAGTVWTFQLHPGASWSDGSPLTSADVVFTVNTILKYRATATASGAGWLVNVASARAASASSVVITYQKPTSNVLGRLARMPILPEHVWSRYATGDGLGLKTFQNNAPLVSGGPYRLAKYTKGQIALLEPNKHWYGTKPALANFGLQFFVSSDAMVTALEHGQIDYAAPLPVTAAAAVKSRSSLTLVDKPGLRFHDLILNASPNQKADPELRDPRVHLAFEEAVDRTAIVKTAYLGYATPGSTIIPPATGSWHDSQIQVVGFDLAKANATLDAAGYRRGPGGVRVANGHQMSYTVLIPGNVEGGEGERALQIITADFAKIGVELHTNITDNTTVQSLITGSDNKYSTFQLVRWGWIPQPDPDFMLSALTCAQLGGLSDSGYCNPAYDKLYEEQASTIDPAKRQAIVWQMQQLLYTSGPYIVTNYDDVLEAHSTAWQGFGDSPQGVLDTASRLVLTSAHRS